MSRRLILLTTSSHGFNRACLGHRWCRFPTRLPKPRTGPGPSMGLPFFLGVFLLRQSCQVLFQLVIHRLLDGANGESQRAVSHFSGLSSHLRGFCIDQSLLFQLPYVFCNGVGAHACVLANPPDTGPALMRFSVLAENQVGVHRQFART